jgi:hypothetical protein
VLLLRIIVEAEDRDQLVEIADYMKQKFPETFDYSNPALTV